MHVAVGVAEHEEVVVLEDVDAGEIGGADDDGLAVGGHLWLEDVLRSRRNRVAQTTSNLGHAAWPPSKSARRCA